MSGQVGRSSPKKGDGKASRLEMESAPKGKAKLHLPEDGFQNQDRDQARNLGQSCKDESFPWRGSTHVSSVQEMQASPHPLTQMGWHSWGAGRRKGERQWMGRQGDDCSQAKGHVATFFFLIPLFRLLVKTPTLPRNQRGPPINGSQNIILLGIPTAGLRLALFSKHVRLSYPPTAPDRPTPLLTGMQALLLSFCPMGFHTCGDLWLPPVPHQTGNSSARGVCRGRGARERATSLLFPQYPAHGRSQYLVADE